MWLAENYKITMLQKERTVKEEDEEKQELE